MEVLDVRPGDLIAPNTPVATLLERDQTYVRIYIPETQFGRGASGPESRNPRRFVPQRDFSRRRGTDQSASGISAAQCPDPEERVHQVFGVKVRIDDPSHRVLAGMAADVKLATRRNNPMATSGEQLAQSHAEHLVRRFGQFTAVDDVSFQMKKGEIFGFSRPQRQRQNDGDQDAHRITAADCRKAIVQGIDVRKDPGRGSRKHRIHVAELQFV